MNTSGSDTSSSSPLSSSRSATHKTKPLAGSPKLIVRLLVIAVLTVAVSINPVPRTAPWRLTGPPVGLIITNCLLIATAVALCLPLLGRGRPAVLKIVALLFIVANIWFAIQIIDEYRL